MLKRAVVVGASSGMGAALVRRLCREGYQVAAVARRKEALDELCDQINSRSTGRRAWPFVHDVTQPETAGEVFAEIVATLDGLDLVVYSAGVMPTVAEDQFDTTVDKTIIDVNVVGAMAWLNPAAERFQVQQGGTIVGIGSVAGDRGRYGNPAYCTSKAALHTYLEALRNRLSRHGVNVVTIKPGPVRTPMTAGMDKLPMVIEVDDAADRIFRAINRGANVAYVPGQWMPIMAVIKSIPSFLFSRTKI